MILGVRQMAKGNGSAGCGCLIVIALIAAFLSSRNPNEQIVVAPPQPDRQPAIRVAVNPRPDAAAAKPKDNEIQTNEATHADLAKTAADAQAKLERLNEEMAEFEVAKAEYHSAENLRLARQLQFLAAKADSSGKENDRARLERSAQSWFRSIVKYYPETEAADDAEQLLLGAEVAERPMPPLPKLPEGVKAESDDIADKAVKEAAALQAATEKPTREKIRRQRDWTNQPTTIGSVYRGPAGAYSSGGAKTVRVRSYTRKDGTVVRAHTRSAPGRGGGRKR